MGGTIKFDYYYGIEADQFSFYRVPRMLIKDERFKGLSSDAKLLYGLMLDRMSLSMKNGWLDDENRAYIIYTVDAIMEDLGCGKDKAIKVLAELDTNKGIGLVERIRRGLGKPDIIYVKNFVVSQETEEKTDKMQEDSDTLAEVGDADLQKSEKPNSRSLRSRLQEVGKIEFRNSENQTSRGGTLYTYNLTDNLKQYLIQCLVQPVSIFHVMLVLNIFLNQLYICVYILHPIHRIRLFLLTLRLIDRIDFIHISIILICLIIVSINRD